ncbi:MAG TPA: L,D-transpeptidase [Allocoleopsis sp.]
MKQKVTNASRPQNLLRLGLSVAMLGLGMQRQALASFVPDDLMSRDKQSLDFRLLDRPRIPPLGAPSLYLPTEDVAPERTTTTDNRRLVLKLHDRRVYVYQNDTVIASYPVAVGKQGWETPTGTYKVIDMKRNPAWQHPWNGSIVPPGPDNPLGLRWIGFWTDGRNFIGFHGTPDEKLIGQAVSHGCVRMRNKDIMALYTQVQLGTPVTVEP